MIAEPTGLSGGLCGLSGIAHGLLVFYVLGLIRTGAGNRALICTAWTTLAVVVAKSIIESITGSVMFSSLHLGDVSLPVTACHAGGALGGIITSLVFPASQRH